MEDKNIEFTKAQDSSITTISTDLIALLANRKNIKDTPSHISKIINRSVKDVYYRKYHNISGLRHGHYINNPDNFNQTYGNILKLTKNQHSVIYRNIASPTMYGIPVMDALDKKFLEIPFSKISENDIYLFSSMASIIIGCTHIFPDANGRTAIALAAYYITRYTNKKLDFQKISQEDTADNRHAVVQILSKSSLGLLPVPYKPEFVIEDLIKNGFSETTISTPTSKWYPAKNVKDFLSDFSNSIISHIEKYEPNNDHGNDYFFYEGISELSNIYKHCSVLK